MPHPGSPMLQGTRLHCSKGGLLASSHNTVAKECLECGAGLRNAEVQSVFAYNNKLCNSCLRAPLRIGTQPFYDLCHGKHVIIMAE
ncbi:hypothetical protein NDU88_004235 [Pleurodeles waltl]|uniref:LIM zinc-binding domain-containing protein n=1 Tax=Pleurodeles waltl TaxID=8319 RepID=A0AAV7NJ61_PLEWA|nr:hypothetical protein NDU88_004235 [Pleurodeles waltl]